MNERFETSRKMREGWILGTAHNPAADCEHFICMSYERGFYLGKLDDPNLVIKAGSERDWASDIAMFKDKQFLNTKHHIRIGFKRIVLEAVEFGLKAYKFTRMEVSSFGN